jgi:hypothetical protein
MRSLARYNTKMLDKAHKGRIGPVDVIVKYDIIFVGMESKSIGNVVVGEGNWYVVSWKRKLRKIFLCTIPPKAVAYWTHQWYWVYQWYTFPPESISSLSMRWFPPIIPLMVYMG